MKHREGDGLEKLVTTALAQQHRAGLSELLRVFAEEVGATACILWRETPWSRLDAVPPEGQLFVFADWYPDGRRCMQHAMPLSTSRTGEAVRTSRPIAVDDVRSNPGVDRTDPWLDEAGIETFCCVPVTFLSGKRGSLNAYRTTKQPFSEAELTHLDRLARILPRLYRTVSDKTRYELLFKISGILGTSRRASSIGGDESGDSLEKEFAHTADALCQALAESFDALEASLFLEDPWRDPGRFYLCGTTWPKAEPFPKQDYRAAAEEGLTGYVLEHGRSVRIFDLGHFEEERESLRETYPGLVWRNSLDIAPVARRLLRISQTDRLQPLSFIAAPVRAAGRTLGAVRCCTSRRGPYRYSDRDEALLGLVADQIGQAWNDRLAKWQTEEENRSWRRLVASLGELNREVQRQIAEGHPNEERILSQALLATRSVVTNAEILDVRLLDERKRELYFAAMEGPAWSEGDAEAIEARRERKFPVGSLLPSPSAGAYVVLTRKTLVLPDDFNEEFKSVPTFPERPRRSILAPIPVKEKVLGVLDLRAGSDIPFPLHARSIAELFGQQLGLYHDLVKTLASFQTLQDQQAKTFEDFAHQIRSPIFQANKRVQAVVGMAQSDWMTPQRLLPHLLALRGIAGRATRVSQGLGLFASLAQDKPLSVRLERLWQPNLTKMLIEAALDQKNTTDPRRELDFRVDPDGLEVLRTNDVRVDKSLFLQAVSNLIDNAAKYSYPRTTTRIFGGLTASGRFHLSVINRGIPLRGSDVKNCRQRGWRGSSAEDVAGEGSGIGLWIVHHILLAHGGDLLIIPTTGEGDTEVKLLLPVHR